MKKTPAQKVENVFTSVIKRYTGVNMPLYGFDVNPSRRMDDTPPTTPGEAALDRDHEVPPKTVDIRVKSCKVVPDLDDEWEAEVEVIVRAQMDDNKARTVDKGAQVLFEAISDFPALRDSLNYPNPNMPERDFYLVDCFQLSQDQDNYDRFWKEIVCLMVKFRPDNGQGTQPSES